MLIQKIIVLFLCFFFIGWLWWKFAFDWMIRSLWLLLPIIMEGRSWDHQERFCFAVRIKLNQLTRWILYIYRFVQHTLFCFPYFCVNNSNVCLLHPNMKVFSQKSLTFFKSVLFLLFHLCMLYYVEKKSKLRNQMQSKMWSVSAGTRGDLEASDSL